MGMNLQKTLPNVKVSESRDSMLTEMKINIFKGTILL